MDPVPEQIDSDAIGPKGSDRNASDAIGPGVSLRVITGSRLHFGLLDTAAPFGGAGVMIDHPATEIMIEKSGSFRCNDNVALRVLAIARRVSTVAGLRSLPRCHVKIAARPPEHSGLGSGTQLSLAAAEALCRFAGVEMDPLMLAGEIAGRGERSAVGIHGYFQGGLIYESPDQPSGQQPGLNPIRQRVELPGEWCVAIFRPRETLSLVSGEAERQQFAKLVPSDSKQRDELRSILQQQLIPAAQASDLDAFASAVGQYNYQSGLLFESIQGGAYNGEAVSSLVRSLVDRGARGVGQSSWGPSVFAWFESTEQAEDFVSDLPADFASSTLSNPRNHGRVFER